MDETMRRRAAELRKMPSSDAADWLLRTYPTGGDAFALLEHVSLRGGDLRRLAKQYLAGPTFAQERPYRVFARLLGIQTMIRVLAGFDGRSQRDAELLAYHLTPMLKGAESENDREALSAFVASLSSP